MLKTGSLLRGASRSSAPCAVARIAHPYWAILSLAVWKIIMCIHVKTSLSQNIAKLSSSGVIFILCVLPLLRNLIVDRLRELYFDKTCITKIITMLRFFYGYINKENKCDRSLYCLTYIYFLETGSKLISCSFLWTFPPPN